MPDDLTSAVAEFLSQERGGDVAPASKPATTTPAPASKDEAAQPAEHQTDSATPVKKAEATKDAPPALSPDVFDTLTPEQVKELLRRNKAAQAEVYRHAQSMKDKELLRIQREQEEARRRDEERRKLEEMDDEEFGHTVREQQHTDEIVRQRAIEAMLPIFHSLQSKTLGKLSDAQIRAQIEQQITSGELGDIDQILDRVLDAEVSARTDKQVAKMEAKLRKEIREAVEKERAADAADDDDINPILGSGLPTGSGELHGMSLLAAGVADMRKEARKRK